MQEPEARRLSERLRHAVAQHAGTASGAASRSAALPSSPLTEELPPLEKILQGAWVETEHGPTFVRDETFPLDHLHGRIPLGALLERTAPDLAPLASMGFGENSLHPSRLAFFDVETTGTSGGTGTYIFLAGLGSFSEEGFRVRQYFLADLSHEHAMLSLLGRDLEELDGLVTYNGRAFDVPCVQTRTVLARLPFPCGRLPHLDLLHVVRRLYRHRLPSCRLLEAEGKLLGLERTDDVPGWLIPSLYFDYVRAQRAAQLKSVFRHNTADILSLVGLLAAIAQLFLRDDAGGEDALALARWWERARKIERAAAFYRRALAHFEGKEDWPWIARRQAFLLKRTGESGEALGLWSRLWSQGDPAAGLELAKHLEHRARDLAAAEEVTRSLLERALPAERAELEHRLARIERRRTRIRAE